MNYKKLLGAASATLIVIILTMVLAPGAWAQSGYKTLYKFKGGKDGAVSQGLIFDQAGNLYGTTSGAGGVGTVFKLTRNSSGTWNESVLCSFGNSVLNSDLIFDRAGNLYGTTYAGDGAYGWGTVFKLAPNTDGSWTKSVIYNFGQPRKNGIAPSGGLIFDQAGNLYGTTSGYYDCDYFSDCGNVFKLTPNSDGSWTESVLYSFCSLTNCSDGEYPSATLVFDQTGNLYGTTSVGGANDLGVVFKLAPNSDGSWTESVLYSFCSLTNCRDGSGTAGLTALIFDQKGNLYGASYWGGAYGGGVVFQLAPHSDRTWTEKVLHHFTGGRDGGNPGTRLIFDQAGSLYGTAVRGGNLTCGWNGEGCGVVFKLTPNSNGGWNETRLHTFLNHPGAHPYCGVILDSGGSLYGTTGGDTHTTFGSVFEITP